MEEPRAGRRLTVVKRTAAKPTAVKRNAATNVYLPTGHRLGRYEVLVKLATGGMAVVYIGRAHGLAGFERLVALKVLHQNLAHEEEFVRMFLDEARLAARIRHPNVVPTIDISDTPDTGFFIVMDYVEGDHLGALFAAAHRAGAPLPLPVTLRVVADALAGLGAAHDLRNERGELLNLVHRDVSPHNIIVGSDGVARLTDFGVAKAENRLAHTRDGQLKGKLAYMAPEQALRGSCDARSDLFAMGVILWEAVTGRRLFRADNPGATLTKLLHDPIVAPSTIDPMLEPLDGLLARALDRNPDGRYQSAEELIDAIERVAPNVGGLASLREVSAVVRELTAEKLRKEHELLELAKEALLLQNGVVVTRDPTDTSHITSHSDVSIASMSLSRSKVSGVFSNATATGLQVGQSLSPPLVPPPPAGQLAPNSDWARRRTPARAKWVVGGLALVSVAALLWLWLMPPSQPIASSLRDEDSVVTQPVRTAEPLKLEAPAPTVAPDELELKPAPSTTSDVPTPAATSGEVRGSTVIREAKTPRPVRSGRGDVAKPAPLADDLMVNPYRKP
jgi:serine/threonine protein kinase